MAASQVTFATSSDIVQVHLPDGRVLQGPRNAPASEFIKPILDTLPAPAVGVILNGQLHELTYPVEMEAQLVPVTMADSDGARIYRRSLTFLLETAFSRLFPEHILIIDHSVTSGGYYCHLENHQPLTREQMSHLQTEMRHLVDADLPYQRAELPAEEAIAILQRENYLDKVRLLKYRRKSHVTLYSIGDHIDYHHGYMVPSTGYLKWFALIPAGDGFLLRFPQRSAPTTLQPMEEYPKLIVVFRQYGDWLEKLGIDNVGALNETIEAGRIREVILVSEALHEQQITSIAHEIARRRDTTRIVLISGPSSSGKTTFSRRLAVQMIAHGLSPYALEMDNYFVDRDLTPRDANGQFDFEALEALNLPLFADHLTRLLHGETVQLPRYNFKSGRSEQGETACLRPDQIIILEGIHGLNPRLIPETLASQAFRIYGSSLTQLNLDRHNRVPTTDTRLLRRIVRDARTRGYSAQQTISRWDSVRRGEEKHIFPYQENADRMFNSALVYELSALKPLVEPLLRQVPPGTPEYIETKRLLAFLEWFLPLESTDLIPDNSILREFIGGSILEGFKVWGA